MTLEHIVKKYGVDVGGVLPIEIPNVGRNELADLFRDLNFRTGAEIGVESGEFSEIICKKNPNVHLLCVDSWRSYDGYKEANQHMEENCTRACERLKPYHCKIMRMSSVIAASITPDVSLDFVYIDAAHDLRHVIEDIDVWQKKIRPGGIIAGHDYRYTIMKDSHGHRKKNTSHHVVTAVRAYTEAYDIHPWFVLGRKKKVDGEIRDRNRSWMWVKST